MKAPQIRRKLDSKLTQKPDFIYKVCRKLSKLCKSINYITTFSFLNRELNVDAVNSSNLRIIYGNRYVKKTDKQTKNNIPINLRNLHNLRGLFINALPNLPFNLRLIYGDECMGVN